jgi:hypothetical protein
MMMMLILARGVKANKDVKQGLRVVQSFCQYHFTNTPYAHFIHLSSTAMTAQLNQVMKERMAASYCSMRYFALQKDSLLPMAKFVCRSDILNVGMSLYCNAANYAGRHIEKFPFQQSYLPVYCNARYKIVYFMHT